MQKIFFIFITIVFLAGCDNSTSQTSTVSASSCTSCRIYVTTNSNWGNQGGINGADSRCNNDIKHPYGTTFKAMLVDGINRIACTTNGCSGGASEHVGWVLKANTTYFRMDSTVIGTTNSVGLLPSSLTNSISSSVLSVWTGLVNSGAGEWTTSANTCGAWTISASGNGVTGGSNGTNFLATSIGSLSCSSGGYLYCAEQ